MFEQVRYFLDGTVLEKGVTKPTATQPVQYPSADEVISEAVHSMIPALYSPYPEGLPDEMSPLASPVNVASIRLVNIIGTVDKDTTLPPLPTTLSITANYP